MDKETFEKLSHYQHEIWSSWMKYMFSLCDKEKHPFEDKETGNLIIPRAKIKRWKKQIATSYEKLSEKEKQSDRDQVNKFIHLFEDK